MKLFSRDFFRLRESVPAILLILAISSIVIGLMLVLHFWKGIPFSHLTRDPISIGKLSFYSGFLSQVGIFFWSATVAICYFGVTVLRSRPDLQKLRAFLFCSALLSTMLGIDDAFLLHEEVFPYYLGIPQNLVLASYVVFVLLYLYKFLPVILLTEYMLLLISLSFFALSVFLDVVHLPGINPYLLEDSAKLIGLVSWLTYFFRATEYSVKLTMKKN